MHCLNVVSFSHSYIYFNFIYVDELMFSDIANTASQNVFWKNGVYCMFFIKVIQRKRCYLRFTQTLKHKKQHQNVDELMFFRHSKTLRPKMFFGRIGYIACSSSKWSKENGVTCVSLKHKKQHQNNEKWNNVVNSTQYVNKTSISFLTCTCQTFRGTSLEWNFICILLSHQPHPGR